MTSATKLICTTPAPITPGSIKRSSSLTRGVSRGTGSLRLMPACRAATMSHTN